MASLPEAAGSSAKQAQDPAASASASSSANSFFMNDVSCIRNRFRRPGGRRLSG